jgi:putative two-component system response regulator
MSGAATVPISTEHDDATLLGVLGMLDFVILEREDDASFRLRSNPCDWFRALFVPTAASEFAMQFGARSDYLNNFLIDAFEFWTSGRPGKIYSGNWVEVDSAGREWPLEAQALNHRGDAFLVIEHLAERYRQQSTVLQVAREHLLNEDALEREVRRRSAAIRHREEEIAIRLLSVASVRDGETAGHVRRIGLYAAAVAEALGWGISRAEDMKIAAPMHDIGKIGIPDAILRKPGRLTDDEYRIMQRHTVIGAEMLAGSDIPLLNMGREIALCHHEKWNGTGYPSGLKGEDIPVAARIVTIVDVYDAMLSRRVYKDPIAESDVLEAMARAAGQDFDPSLFEIFTLVLPRIRQIRGAIADDPG